MINMFGLLIRLIEGLNSVAEVTLKACLFLWLLWMIHNEAIKLGLINNG
jgi:hypothetical protein